MGTILILGVCLVLAAAFLYSVYTAIEQYDEAGSASDSERDHE